MKGIHSATPGENISAMIAAAAARLAANLTLSEKTSAAVPGLSCCPATPIRE